MKIVEENNRLRVRRNKNIYKGETEGGELIGYKKGKKDSKEKDNKEKKMLIV